MRTTLKRAAALSGIALAVLAGLRLWPHAPLRDTIPLSTIVLDRRDEALRITLAEDGQLRLWTPLREMPPSLVEAVLLHEDQHFWWHPGINPVALVRAAVATATGGARQGASTITMQLTRLRAGHNTRSVIAKLRQITDALWLEARYSKREILEAYLNLTPYGGNVQGVGAAARLGFDKRPDQLDLAQTLALAVMPQAPESRALRDQESAGLHAARLRLFARWLTRHPDDARQTALVEAPLRFNRQPVPFEAPHFTTMALRRNAESAAQTLHTTLDLRLQNLLERRLREHLVPLAREGVRNASALLVDTRDMSVRAWIGSAAYDNAGIDGQVDGVLARRSPGSTLKPMLYALAMDQGLIHPLTVLKDAPTWFGPYAPENSDGHFLGPITAHDALIRSRNVPAVQLSARLGDPTLYRFLKSADVALPMSERHYGLALTLGGGEVSMVELAQLYAMLANRGVWKPLRWRADAPADDGRRLLSEASSFMVLDILRDNPRPDDAIAQPALRALMPAWKTGTSWGFRDAWTAGVLGPYVLVVWVGNFDGQGNPAFVGVQTAAPLFFDLLDALRAAEAVPASPQYRTPPQLAKIDVCAASGDLPNVDCPQRVKTWFIPGVSPIRISNVHRRVYIDTRTGKPACPPYDPATTRSEVYEFWPSDLQKLFAQAGIPRRSPPSGDCGLADAASGKPPGITSPLSGATYLFRPLEISSPGDAPPDAARSDQVPLLANADGDVAALYWFVDENYVGSTRPGAALPWQPSGSGEHSVRVVDDHGRADARILRVALAP